MSTRVVYAFASMYIKRSTETHMRAYIVVAISSLFQGRYLLTALILLTGSAFGERDRDGSLQQREHGRSKSLMMSRNVIYPLLSNNERLP